MVNNFSRITAKNYTTLYTTYNERVNSYVCSYQDNLQSRGKCQSYEELIDPVIKDNLIRIKIDLMYVMIDDTNLLLLLKNGSAATDELIESFKNALFVGVIFLDKGGFAILSEISCFFKLSNHFAKRFTAGFSFSDFTFELTEIETSRSTNSFNSLTG